MSRNEESKVTDQEIASEMAQVPWEPLLSVEKKLIAGSLILGVVLLALLYWVSNHYFPTP